MSLQAPPAVAAALPAVFAPLRYELATLAEAWLDDGASEVALHYGDERVAVAGRPGSCSDTALSAPIAVPGFRADLVIAGVSRAQMARVRSDAELIGRLATREQELRQLTDSLIAANDRMIALHDLATTSIPSLDPAEVRTSIAGEALRLTAGAAVVITGPGSDLVAAGAYPIRTELEQLATGHTGVTCEVLPRGVGDADVAIAPIAGPGDGIVAIAAHRGQSFEADALEIIDAIALRVRAQIGLGQLHDAAVGRALHQQSSETIAELETLLPTDAPDAIGLTTAARTCADSPGAGGFFTGLTTPNGATFIMGVPDATNIAAAIQTLNVAAVAGTELAREPLADPVGIIAEIRRQTTTGLQRADTRLGLAVGRWDTRQSVLTLAHTDGVHAIIRRGGTASEGASTGPALGASPAATLCHDLRLDAGDALLLASPTLLQQPSRDGRPLGSDALAAAMTTRADHTADQLLSHLFALVQRHQGLSPSLPNKIALSLVREHSG